MGVAFVDRCDERTPLAAVLLMLRRFIGEMSEGTVWRTGTWKEYAARGWSRSGLGWSGQRAAVSVGSSGNAKSFPRRVTSHGRRARRGRARRRLDLHRRHVGRHGARLAQESPKLGAIPIPAIGGLLGAGEV